MHLVEYDLLINIMKTHSNVQQNDIVELRFDTIEHIRDAHIKDGAIILDSWEEKLRMSRKR